MYTVQHIGLPQMSKKSSQQSPKPMQSGSQKQVAGEPAQYPPRQQSVYPAAAQEPARGMIECMSIQVQS